MQDEMNWKDEVICCGKWVFDKEVSDCFDDMLKRSIPNYMAMREMTFDIGKSFIKPFSKVLDIGCSNGKSMERFAQYCDMKNKVEGWFTEVHGIDESLPMVEEARKRLERIEAAKIQHRDVLKGLPNNRYDLILSVLTAQFTPLEYRHSILSNVYESLNSGGAFIFVEKVLCKDADMNDFFVEKYYDIKRRNGYTEEQIETKRESLKGVLVPLTDDWNRQLLESVGFRKVECFWRCYNFLGYLCVKD